MKQMQILTKKQIQTLKWNKCKYKHWKEKKNWTKYFVYKCLAIDADELFSVFVWFWDNFVDKLQVILMKQFASFDDEDDVSRISHL